MAAIAALIGGLALTGAGVATQYSASQRASSAQEAGIAAQQRAETARNKQMQLDATRRRRELVRQGILARSQALTKASGQGAQFGSVLPGAYGGIQGQTAFNVAGVDQSLAIGNDIFGANQDLFAARRSEASAGSQAALGAGLQSLGGTLVNNIGTINRLGTNYGIA